MTDAPVRMLVVWCRDWPVVALERPVGDPIAVVWANRVVATSASARVAGVAEGLRRREAQRRCPDLVVVERDDDRDARAFERIAGALDDITPRIEITRSGSTWCQTVRSIPTWSPSRVGDQSESSAVAFRPSPCVADMV